MIKACLLLTSEKLNMTPYEVSKAVDPEVFNFLNGGIKFSQLGTRWQSLFKDHYRCLHDLAERHLYTKLEEMLKKHKDFINVVNEQNQTVLVSILSKPVNLPQVSLPQVSLPEVNSVVKTLLRKGTDVHILDDYKRNAESYARENYGHLVLEIISYNL